MSGFAWVTLATNDSYSLGALVLAHSLRRVGTAHQLAVLVTPGVTGVMREKLAAVFNVVREVNILDSRDEANLRLLQRPDLGITFTKLHCWRLTQFNKCVFLDADTLVLQNADELFEREEFSAAPDVGWPDCFNSGVFVYRPSEDTYGKLIQFALEKGSFDGGDQGLLNLYFSDWAYKDISKHLPFIYNMCSTACYSYLPAFKQFGGNVKIVHFIGNAKPWLQYFDTETRQVHTTPGLQHLSSIVQHWWDIFCSLVHPTLSPQMAGLAGAFAQLTLGVPRTAEQSSLEDHLRRQGWEVGNIDYMGRDSFDNIWSKICQTLSTNGSTAAPTPAPVEIAKAAPTQTAAPTPSTVPAQSQQVPEPAKSSEIDSAAKECPVKAAELPVAPQQSEPESAPQTGGASQEEIKPITASKPVESCPKPTPVAQTESSEPTAAAAPVEPSPAVTSEIKPPTPASELPKEAATIPSQTPQPVIAPKGTIKPTLPSQPPPETPTETATAPSKAQQTPPSSPSPKTEASAPKAQKTAPSTPSPKPEPAAPKPQQTPPSSPAPKTEAPKLQQTPPATPSPKTEAAAPKAQQTPPSTPSPKPEAAVPKLQQTPPTSPSPKAQPKTAPIKEAAATPPESPQPKTAPAKKTAAAEPAAGEKPSSEEAPAASGGQGPTPPPRKTGGGSAGGPKKSGKGKK